MKGKEYKIQSITKRDPKGIPEGAEGEEQMEIEHRKSKYEHHELKGTLTIQEQVCEIFGFCTSSLNAQHYSFLMVIVQRRSESDCTVILSSLTRFEVLTKPPNLISVSSERKKEERVRLSSQLKPIKDSTKVTINKPCATQKYSLRSHWSPVVVVLPDGVPMGMSPQ